MNLSMQMVRGLSALAMCAAVSAYALTQPVVAAAPAADGHEVAVAHSRLEIVVASDADNTPHYQVASIRVGKPEPLAPEQTRRTVMHTRLGDVHS
jgi:hypothetical protein